MKGYEYIYSWWESLPIHYTGFNCGQCWLCKNCTSQHEVKLDNHTILLPYCKRMELAMTHVHDEKCRLFTLRSDIAPGIEVAPVRHCKWKYASERGGIYAECTACHEEIYQADEYLYCPNCGAKVDGEITGEITDG